MYNDNVGGLVFRPPGEAHSFIIRAAIGCSHNACSFCAMYKNQSFRPRKLSEIYRLVTAAAAGNSGVRRVFIADGNALTLKTDTLLSILDILRTNFTRLTRVGIYANARDILHKSREELTALRTAGLKVVYMGIESGDPLILQQCRKGVTPAQIVEAGKKIREAGIKLSATVILGLGGRENTMPHALNTARIINEIQPAMLSALSLMIYPHTPLAEEIAAGKFTPLNTRETIDEQYRLINEIDVQTPCIFRSNHVSNYVPLEGTLPKHKTVMLDTLRAVLANQNLPTYYNNKE